MAYNFAQGGSGALSGALSGAAMGSVVPGIGTALGAIGGGLAGLLGGFGGGEGMQQGYDIVEMPQYSFTEPMLRQTSDYLSDAMSRLGRGEYPSYYENALPTLRKAMADPLYQTYYGRPGERSGLVQQAMQVGAMTGLGPKSTNVQASKQMQNYATQEQQIDQYLTQIGVDVMNQQAQQIPQYMMSMPQGPNAQIVNYMGGVGGSSYENPMLSLASQVPWESLFSKNQNLMGGNTLAGYNAMGNAAANAGYGSSFTSQYR